MVNRKVYGCLVTYISYHYNRNVYGCLVTYISYHYNRKVYGCLVTYISYHYNRKVYGCLVTYISYHYNNQQLLQTCSDLMDVGLSISYFTDLGFFCSSECIHSITWTRVFFILNYYMLSPLASVIRSKGKFTLEQAMKAQ